MKKILLSLIAVAVLCFSARAQQPIYAQQSLLNFTNTASTYTNVSGTIDCRKQASVAIQWIAGGQTGSSTATNNIFIQRSLDGVVWSTADNDATPNGQIGKRITITLNAITPVMMITNIPTQGCGYMKVYGPTNSDATVTSTNLVSYGVKINAP